MVTGLKYAHRCGKVATGIATCIFRHTSYGISFNPNTERNIEQVPFISISSTAFYLF